MLPVVILFCVAFSLCALLIGISYFFGAKKNVTKIKNSPYECGVPAVSSPSTRISVKFFLTALLFIIFDIEIIFIYPFAMAYRTILAHEEVYPILFGVAFFLVLFVFGLWWEIKTKALEWK